MKKRTFIRLSGLTSIGILAGGNLFASSFKIRNQQFINIEAPNIHVRHGFFNIQTANHNGLYVQRDIFNKNGLEALSDDRIVSIKISDQEIETYGISDNTGFNSKSNKLVAIKLEANKTTSIKIDTPSLIFSEHGKIELNGMSVSMNQAVIQDSSIELELLSESNQSVFIYEFRT